MASTQRGDAREAGNKTKYPFQKDTLFLLMKRICKRQWSTHFKIDSPAQTCRRDIG